MNNSDIPYHIHVAPSPSLETGITRSNILELNDTAANFIDEGNLEPAYYVLLEALEMLSNCVLPPTPVEESLVSDSHFSQLHVVEPASGRQSTVVAEQRHQEPQHRQPHRRPRGNQQVPPDQEMQDISNDDDSMNSNESQENEDDYSVWEQEQLDQDASYLPDFYPFPFSFHFDLRSVPPADVFEDEDSEPEMTKDQYNICAVSILFNLGLCCHLRWDDARSKLKSQSSTLADEHLKWLRRAVQFYQEAILLLRTDPSVLAFLQKDRKGALLLKMLVAVCVNAIQIHTTLARTPQLQTFQTVLKRLVGMASPEVRKGRVFQVLWGFLCQESLSRAPAA